MSTQLRVVEAHQKLDTLERSFPRSVNRFTLFRMLSSQPRSAVSLARELRRTVSHVRGMIERLRDDGVPVWNVRAEGFWTDLDFSNVPKRRGNKGYSAQWQRRPVVQLRLAA